MELIFEVGYIVEPAKHRNIYRIVGIEICDTSLARKKVSLWDYASTLERIANGSVVNVGLHSLHSERMKWDKWFEYYLVMVKDFKYLGIDYRMMMDAIQSSYAVSGYNLLKAKDKYFIIGVHKDRNETRIMDCNLPAYLRDGSRIAFSDSTVFALIEKEHPNIHIAVETNGKKFEYKLIQTKNNLGVCIDTLDTLELIFYAFDYRYHIERFTYNGLCEYRSIASNLRMLSTEGVFTGLNGYYCLDFNRYSGEDTLVLPKDCKFLSSISLIGSDILSNLRNLVINPNFKKYKHSYDDIGLSKASKLRCIAFSRGKKISEIWHIIYELFVNYSREIYVCSNELSDTRPIDEEIVKASNLLSSILKRNITLKLY